VFAMFLSMQHAQPCLIAGDIAGVTVLSHRYLRTILTTHRLSEFTEQAADAILVFATRLRQDFDRPTAVQSRRPGRCAAYDRH
jgi:hypothetical protein